MEVYTHVEKSVDLYAKRGWRNCQKLKYMLIACEDTKRRK